MRVDVWLELQDTLLREYVRNDFALSRVIRPRPSGENVAADGNEGIVEVRF